MKLNLTQVFAISEVASLHVRKMNLEIKIAKKSEELHENHGVEIEPPADVDALKREIEALKSERETLQYDLKQAQRDRDYWSGTNREHAAKLATAQATIQAIKSLGVLCEHDAAPSVCPSCKYIKEPAFTAEEIGLIKDGKPIEATKRVRDRTQIGLKEAKVVVDAWVGRL